jgi:transmembrane sensor
MSPNEPGTPNHSLLARYLSGECDATESAIVRAWIARDPSHQAELDHVAQAWNPAPAPEYDATRAVWARIASRLDESPQSPRTDSRVMQINPRESLRGRRHFAWKNAAAVLIVIAGATTAGFAARSWLFSPGETRVAVEMREIATRPGQRLELDLTDGTHVVLGPASRFRYPIRFAKARNVELVGEAYFDVAHDDARPFAVETTRGIARDIGTRFGVSAYADDRSMQVVVEEGSVSVSSKSSLAEGKILVPGDLARVAENGSLTVERGVEVDSYLAWASGRLVLKNMPLRVALAQINRWYDADIRIGDSRIAEYPITATFATESLSQVVAIVAAAIDARVERDAMTITLYQRRNSR